MGHRILYIPKPSSGIFYPEYGLLYNWPVVVDSRNICSAGWSVPDYLKVKTLREYIDPSGTPSTNTAGEKLKETGTTYFQEPNTYSTNEKQFNARGAGDRVSTTGAFQGIRGSFKGWNITEYPYSTLNAAHFFMSYANTNLIHYIPFTNWFTTPKKSGLSVRPVKDSTSLSDGQTGTYTGNDGKVYRTICIGTQEWLADNLAETRFRNGDIIPWYGADSANYFTNAEWAALTTAGCCAYNNTLSNVAAGFTFPT